MTSLRFRAAAIIPFLSAACGEDQGAGTVDTGLADSDSSPIFEVAPEVETVDSIVFDTGTPDSVLFDTAPDTTPPEDAGEIEQGAFASPCVGNQDCFSGYCVEGPDGYICTRLCDEDCPAGFACRGVTGESDVVFLCMPFTNKLCAPCLDDLQCNGSACALIDGERRCTRDCADDLDCGAGFSCVVAADDPNGKRCEPATGSCTCYEGNDGGLRACRIENGFGVCNGVSTCARAAGWGACDAKTPVAETCNGQDDDCDAFQDEDLAEVGDPCEVTVGGVGSCPGTTVCVGQGGLQCQGPAPLPEGCDFEDDDCDGQVDEDFKTGDAYATFDHCGSCNRSCGIGFPNAQQTTCQLEQGVAQCVVVTCDEGYIKQNDFQCIPDIVNLCEPCSDDSNCLGQGSACVTLADGDFCAKACTDGGGAPDPTSCPVGFSCQTVSGVQRKQCLPTTGVCSCGPATLGLSRACSVTIGGADGPSTTCGGTETCGAGGWGSCILPGEQCNGFDDDCDGTIDDGFKNAAGEYDKVDNCGACDISCLALTFDHATPVCDAGGSGAPQCSFQCVGGYLDIDGIAGCECKPTSTTDLPDPVGVDANCDGIDGEIDKAVFVAKTGDDNGLGTIDDPLRTVQAGISEAAGAGKRDVLVATGVYVESVTLANDVNVYGGYAPDFHERERFTHESAIIGVDPTAAARGAVNALGIASSAANAVIFDGFTVFGADNFVSGGSSYAVYLRNAGAFLTISNNTIIAGTGSNGTAGQKGLDGARGVDGTEGEPALWTTAVSECAPTDEAPGGDPGARSCGGVDVSGGVGGRRVCPVTTDPVQTSDQVHAADENGDDGAFGAQSGGAGGEAGWHQRVGKVANGCTPTSTHNSHNSFGFDGGAGSSGLDGLSASACSAAAGSVDQDGAWIGPIAGQAGNAGHGAGGGGGGAGGGVDVHDCAYRVPLGGSGGGGGSGGCGGTRGESGTSGGGSFAIFVAYTALPSALPTLVDNEIIRGRGGTGGAGGAGGVGGPEGLGGQGGPSRRGEEPGQAYPFNCCVSAGGDGGPGGPGGHGAAGAGGCGGPAYGIFIDPIALGAPRTTISGNTLPASGGGGLGGEGGTGLGAQGPNGGTGLNTATNY